MDKKIPTNEQKEFLMKITAHRKEKVEGLAYKALALALKENIPVFELPYYVLQRAKFVIENAFKKVDFKNAKLQKARLAFAKVCLEEMKKNIEVLEIKEALDETEQRDKECEPIVQTMVQLLLDEELVFSDEEYFNLILTDEESVPLNAAIGGYQMALEEKILMVISEHWRRSTDKLWGVEKEKVRFQMLDDILKR